MPYRTIQDLPVKLQQILPEHAQEIFVSSFNNAWDDYGNSSHSEASSQEEIAYRIAWSAVKKKYIKDEQTGKWIEKE